jgi:hypothetical protein
MIRIETHPNLVVVDRGDRIVPRWMYTIESKEQSREIEPCSFSPELGNTYT